MEKKICPECNINVRKKSLKTVRGVQGYRKSCEYCANGPRTKRYDKRKKNYCEKCGFKAVHMSQLDIDHIDGNHSNKKDENIQTLCSNCHRLKTRMSQDNVNIAKRLNKSRLYSFVNN